MFFSEPAELLSEVAQWVSRALLTRCRGHPPHALHESRLCRTEGGLEAAAERLGAGKPGDAEAQREPEFALREGRGAIRELVQPLPFPLGGSLRRLEKYNAVVGDLAFTLTAPNGDNVHLMSRLGATTSTSFGSSGDFVGGPGRGR